MVIVVFAYLCWRNQNQIEMETKATQRFYQFRGDKMMDTFGIKPVEQCSFLEEWLDAYTNLTDFEDQTLEAALVRYEKMGRGWNESQRRTVRTQNARLRPSDLSVLF
jgi:hypothetical protein